MIMGWCVIRDANGHFIKTMKNKDRSTEKERLVNKQIQEKINTKPIDGFLKPFDDGLLLQQSWFWHKKFMTSHKCSTIYASC
jgi:hypothetical protein